MSKRQTGFTLFEVLAAVAVLGILGALGVGAWGDYMEEVRITQARADILDISQRIDRFRLGMMPLRYPATLAEIGGGGDDPWGNPYVYLNIADSRPSPGKVRKDKNLVPINTDYDLYSMGPDGRSVSPLTAKPSRDDIVRANDGMYVGVAADY